jgi:DNA-directed RNA polymerase specialized sigma24 family protein
MPDPAQLFDHSPHFQTTRWTTVLAARDQSDTSGREAMAALCRAYWYPLYAFVRRSGHAPEDAEDLTQAFFARLLEKDYLSDVVPEKGRFRTFLLVAFKRFLAKEWRKEQALKRGAGAAHIPIDSVNAERRYAAEPVEEASPEILFDRQWALTMIERSLARLRSHYESTGRGELFEHFKAFLTASSREEGFSTAATRAGMSEGAAHVAVHRIRKRFRRCFREELAETVTPERVDEEIDHIRAILAGAR